MRFFNGVFVVALVLSLLGPSHGVIDADLLTELYSGGKADVLVNFKGGNAKAIKCIRGKYFSSRTEKIEALVTALKSLSYESQKGVEKGLAEKGVQSEAFWVSNQRAVYGINLEVVQFIDGFPEVSRIEKSPEIPIPPIQVEPYYYKDNGKGANNINADNVEWGVKKIQADVVWSDSNGTIKGQGVVIANIDTGVLVTHEALRDNFRADHGWMDPYDNSTTPTDPHGHGTHNMGIIAGTTGIGVAPNVTWIACRGCSTKICKCDQLLKCAQFMLQPTNPDGTGGNATYSPDIVSNTWSATSKNDTAFFKGAIDAWTLAGIVHIFPIGDDGKKGCNSTANPGNQPGTFGVGSTDANDTLSDFSSMGPSPYGEVKPDISAPGSNIRSSWVDGNSSSYKVLSGTDMACSHVAGTAVLVLCAHRQKVSNPEAVLAQKDVEDIIQKNAVTTGLKLADGIPNCEDKFPSVPNNAFGYGRVDARDAVNAVKNRTL